MNFTFAQVEEMLNCIECRELGRVCSGHAKQAWASVEKPAEPITEVDLSMDWPEPLPPKEVP